MWAQLKIHEHEIVDLLQRQNGTGKERVQLEREDRPGRLPLSYAQERLWFLDQLEGTSTEYNMPESVHLKGQLDEDALRRAINTIVERHESLRTHFETVEGEPVQVIEERMQIMIPMEDLSELEEAEKQERVEQEVRREGTEPFNLARGPVIRVRLLKLGEREHVLLRTMHHIVSDGWSEGVFNRELEVLYGAYREGRENPLKPLRGQYADFALWQRGRLGGGTLEEEIKYWRGKLQDIPQHLELPTDRPRLAAQTFAAGTC